MKILIPLVMLIMTACNDTTIEDLQNKQYDNLKGNWVGHRYNLTPVQTKEVATLTFDDQTMTINKKDVHSYTLMNPPDLNNFFYIKSDTITMMINEMSASTLIATDIQAQYRFVMIKNFEIK